MKKILFLLSVLGMCTIVNAQPQGFQMPTNNATFKDVNYAGDDLEAHRMDIYLPETGDGPFPTMVLK